jgi:hypothetical protein
VANPTRARWEWKPMRRPLALLIALLVLMIGASPVSAAPPVHEPFAFQPLQFAAGDMCDFALSVSNPR